MNIDQIAVQLRALAPIFDGNIAGAAAYTNGVNDQAWLPLPAAYVVPLDQDADENTSMAGLQQIVHERVGVIVVLETLKVGGAPKDLADRRGQAASAYLDTIKYAIFRAILNWRPDWDITNPPADREGRGIYFVAAGFPQDGAFDRARFFYQFVFGLDTTITDVDGWQQPGEPLIDIRGTITNDGAGTLAVFDVPLPIP
jgi:hypothetical protein